MLQLVAQGSVRYLGRCLSLALRRLLATTCTARSAKSIDMELAASSAQTFNIKLTHLHAQPCLLKLKSMTASKCPQALPSLLTYNVMLVVQAHHHNNCSHLSLGGICVCDHNTHSSLAGRL